MSEAAPKHCDGNYHCLGIYSNKCAGKGRGIILAISPQCGR